MERTRCRTFSAEAFTAWLRQYDLTYTAAAEALGCSRKSVSNFTEIGAPHYIGLACAAVDLGLDPPMFSALELERDTP